MGEIVSFPSNGTSAEGYLAIPAAGNGPGLVVIQEWWGLVDHIKDVCDRFAAEGFVALAPDLYHGQKADEPDDAGKYMMAMSLPQAARDMGGAIDHLRNHQAVTSDGVGVVGYCMGGGLTLLLATQRPDAVRAAVPYYGVIPWPAAQPDWARLEGAVQGHYAEQDDYAPPEKVREMEVLLRSLGKQAEFFIYPGTHHGFFNDDRPEVYNPEAARQAWERTLAFFREHLS
jgi:carboxymethylenebutenolidase